ncbi:MAG TPA: hypothetical protein VLH09_11680 [Bryobacteraceae bacterium]|nr:hypothetical protein [Bryobacteraceae bacterium]
MAVLLPHSDILVADEAWVALALLHNENPQRLSFGAGEIRKRVEAEGIAPNVRAGVTTHIGQHNVANVEPSSGTYRMFYRLPDGTYRLYRAGDECHPRRKGKIVPSRAELPEAYHHLLDWYEREYSASSRMPEADSLLAMVGVGKEIWQEEQGDRYIERLREEWPMETTVPAAVVGVAKPAPEQIWDRIVAHQGEQFLTITGKPFTYVVEHASGIWFSRSGKRIDKKLWRGHVDKAVDRCPLGGPGEIADLFDSSYLYGLLMDSRIRGNDW